MSDCLIITLNCAKLKQDSDVINDLVLNAMSSMSELPDFIVFCLQEVVPICDASFGYLNPYLKPFIDAKQKDYVIIANNHVGAVALLVYAHRKIPPCTFTTNKVSFGHGWSSLKGACSVSLKLDDTRSINFVAAHLAAGQTSLYQLKRNQDFKYLFKHLKISQMSGPVVLAGDLNYRTKDGKFGTDQLSAQLRDMGRGEVFWEPQVLFEPTYKYIVNTDELNNKRVPAWCDRILLTNRNCSDYEVERYDSIDSSVFDNSDHRAVFMRVRMSGNSEKLEYVLDQEVLDTMEGTYNPVQWFVTMGADIAIGVGTFFTMTRPGWAVTAMLVVYFLYHLL